MSTEVRVQFPQAEAALTGMKEMLQQRGNSLRARTEGGAGAMGGGTVSPGLAFEDGELLRKEVSCV